MARRKKPGAHETVSATRQVTLHAIEGQCLGVKVYRGFARLADLARISKPDVYHPVSNPEGTQRDLKSKHAAEAYRYAASAETSRLWPEVVLNIRDRRGIRITPRAAARGPRQEPLQYVKLAIDLSLLKLDENDPSISRVDGNHRLYFAAGDKRRKFEPLDNVWSGFALIDGIDTQTERIIFKTINDEQVALKADHLLRIETQTVPGAQLFSQNPALWLANQLAERDGSPFYNAVSRGERKDKEGPTPLINIKGLVDGLEQFLKQFQQSAQFDPEKLYRLTGNYWRAVKNTWPTEWEDKGRYKLMQNTGLQALGIFGGRLATDLAYRGTAEYDDFCTQLERVRPALEWDKQAEGMRGVAGRAGAEEIAKRLNEAWKSEFTPADVRV